MNGDGRSLIAARRQPVVRFHASVDRSANVEPHSPRHRQAGEADGRVWRSVRKSQNVEGGTGGRIPALAHGEIDARGKREARDRLRARTDVLPVEAQLNRQLV